MATDAPAAPEATPRGRRSSRASGDERERAILATAQSLLETRPLGEISVADLAAGAGISRPTFYFYFESRDAVLLTLVERMADEAAGAIASQEETLSDLQADPRAGIRQALEHSYAAFASRRAVILAAADLRSANADARALWSRVMEDWVAQVSGIIEAERARGAAPPGPPARELATALVQMNERAQHATLSGEAPHLPDDAVIDTLVEIWLRAIYGAAAG